jgi:hypothetical protein
MSYEPALTPEDWLHYGLDPQDDLMNRESIFSGKISDCLYKFFRCRGMKEIERAFCAGEIKQGQLIKVMFAAPFLSNCLSQTGRVIHTVTSAGTHYVRLEDYNGNPIRPRFKTWEPVDSKKYVLFGKN